jgi:hypothetical protein
MLASLDLLGGAAGLRYVDQQHAARRSCWATPGRTGGSMDRPSTLEDAAVIWREGPRMRYKVGAEQMEQIPSLAHRPDGVFKVGQDDPGRPHPCR